MPTILIVDDSLTFREMVSEHLRQGGFTVVQAVDGEDAIAKIRATLPDLVVTDVVMPRKNGYELTRWIKNEPDFKATPVIMCTTKSEESDVYWGKKQGANDYVTKPYHPDDLLTKIKRLLKIKPS
ncbi:MAG TPA: response regulator [Coleofasciculaceae cyanobacterium]